MRGVFPLRKFAQVPLSLVWALLPAQAALAAPAAEASLEAAPVATPEAATQTDKREIVVVGAREKGQVDAPQQPVAVFDEADIAAYGVSSITDLLTAIAPQTGSGRGRGSTMPVILVNGQRIASFRDLRDYPPEAIKKVEVLPEEVALRYGYSADQRVVNFILKDHFFSRSAEGEYAQPQAGGASTVKGNVSLMKITKGRRLNVTIRADHTTPITEAERNVIQTATPTVASDPRPAENRTVQSDTKDYSINGTYTMPLGTGGYGGNLTVNGTVSRTEAKGLSGLNTYAPSTGVLRTFDGALTRTSRTDTYQTGVSLNKSLLDWQLSATVDAGHVEASTATANRVTDNSVLAAALAADATLPGAGFTTSKTTTDTVTSLVTMSGRPVKLPAGKLSLTGKAGFAYSGLQGSSAGGAVATPSTSLKRGDASAGVNIGIPITSRKEHVGEVLGDISLNLSAGLDRLSDFGTLSNWSGGVTWNVTPKLGLQASYVYNEAAPSLSNLGAASVTTQNVSVYDFTTGKTVLAAITTGGNSALVRERRNDIKLGANWTLPGFKDSASLVVEYFNNRSNNVTSAFPTTLTPGLEAAFLGRVTRDPATHLITAIDRRAVTLAEQRDEHIRWGLNIMGTLGKELKGAPGGMFGGMPGGPRRAGAGGPPPGGGAGGPPPGGGAGGPPARYEGRWNLTLYHTVNFVNRVLVAQNGPVLDLLGGDALSGGGTARHALELDAGGFYKGIGLRLNGNWTAPTHVTTTGTAAANDLRFGALLKVNARLFVDFGIMASAGKLPDVFKGTRFSIYANNVFDQVQKVTDASGATPLSYQAAYLDPNGRVLGVELRKTF